MKLIKLFSILIVILFVGNIVVSNKSLDDSKKTAELTSQVIELNHELTILRSQVADATSLTMAAERVAAAGFSDTPKIVTLSVVGRVASR